MLAITVLEIINGDIQMPRVFIGNDINLNSEKAELHFENLCLENGANEDDIGSYIEDGNYTDSNGYEVNLIYSDCTFVEEKMKECTIGGVTFMYKFEEDNEYENAMRSGWDGLPNEDVADYVSSLLCEGGDSGNFSMDLYIDDLLPFGLTGKWEELK